ncbi:hypothetical protein UlMin_039619 [Ulmus minor]
MSRELRSFENPKKWRFTWEAQSHIPTLRLFLFDSRTKPSIHCQNLQVRLNLSQSLVLVSWLEDAEITLRVPVPRVLIDSESPVSVRALDDHIEVKLILLLPIDHPIISRFDTILNLSGDEENVCSDASEPLSVASDIKNLSSSEGVHFYCRNCSAKLTGTPLRNFMEMPSVNWREVADNWFGACCCSFGGISEKLVTKFANSYTCAKGMCLLTFATITVSKDDLVGCNFPEWDGDQSLEAESDVAGEFGFGGSTLNSEIIHSCDDKPRLTKLKDADCSASACDITDEESNNDRLSHLSLEPDYYATEALADGCCTHHISETSPEFLRLAESMVILENKKSFLNGFLENIFMVKSSNLSVDVEWVEFFCPQCSTLLGAYPCGNGRVPVDGGVRFFKCYISTSLPAGGSGDLLRNYTLERMFTNQLLDSAKDELSFRTVVRDLKTKSPMLQIVLANVNSWSCTGFCSIIQSSADPVPKIGLQPVIKVIFSECSNDTESEIRTMEDRVKQDLAEEVFMLRHQIEEMVESLVSAKNLLPPSSTSLQEFSLSSLQK